MIKYCLCDSFPSWDSPSPTVQTQSAFRRVSLSIKKKKKKKGKSHIPHMLCVIILNWVLCVRSARPQLLSRRGHHSAHDYYGMDSSSSRALSVPPSQLEGPFNQQQALQSSWRKSCQTNSLEVGRYAVLALLYFNL